MTHPTPTPSLSPADISVRPTPIPGRLLVDHDAGLGLGQSLRPLADVPLGERVSVSARVEALTLAASRVFLSLADTDGNSATVVVPSGKFTTASLDFGRPIVVGDMVQMHGTVSILIDGMPKSITAFAFRAVAS